MEQESAEVAEEKNEELPHPWMHNTFGMLRVLCSSGFDVAEVSVDDADQLIERNPVASTGHSIRELIAR